MKRKPVNLLFCVAGTGTNGGFGSAATDDGSAQWDVENDSVDGAIYRYIVTSAGSGYSDGSSTFDVDGLNNSRIRCLAYFSNSIIEFFAFKFISFTDHSSILNGL